MFIFNLSFSGHSPLCVQPLPHVMNEAISEHIGSKVSTQVGVSIAM